MIPTILDTNNTLKGLQHTVCGHANSTESEIKLEAKMSSFELLWVRRKEQKNSNSWRKTVAIRKRTFLAVLAVLEIKKVPSSELFDRVLV